MKTDINRIFDINIVEIDDSPPSLPIGFMDDFISIIETSIKTKNKWLSIASLIFKVDRDSQGGLVCEVSLVYKNDTEYTNRYWRGYILPKI